jgi:glycosyltransferase involved in cell wall biosynthesis
LANFGFIDSWLKEAKEGSGTAVAISGLKKGLEKNGHRVSLFSPSSLPPPLFLNRLRFNFKILPRLLSSKTDVIVGFDIDGWLYALLRRKGSRYFCSLKGIASDEARYEKGFVKRLLQAHGELEKWNVRASDRVITDSRYCQKRIQALYGVPKHKIKIVPEGIDVDFWRRRLAAFRKKTKRNKKSSVTILCVARQYPRKRVELLLKAAAKIRKKFPDLKLRIIGKGPEHSRLQALAAKLHWKEALIGTVDDVISEYAAADIFCLPSVQEGFGIVFLEAMVAGLPIVAARATAVPEVVLDGINGLLAKPESVESLAVALERLIKNPKLRRRLGQAGRKRVVRYDWKRVGKEFAGYLKSS